MTRNRFIISGGGTGGHIYPALSIANEINKSFDNPEIKFIGARGKMEMNIIPKYGYKIHGLLISGLQRSFTLKNILLPFKLIISLVQSIIIILSFRPNFVVGTHNANRSTGSGRWRLRSFLRLLFLRSFCFIVICSVQLLHQLQSLLGHHHF